MSDNIQKNSFFGVNFCWTNLKCHLSSFPFRRSPSRDRDNKLRDEVDGGDDLSHVYLSYGSAAGGIETSGGRPRTARGKAAATGRPKSGKPKAKR